MMRQLTHRGPDSQGHWAATERGPVLGHTRLAIQDLSDAGHQPMHSRCGRYCMVLNGEVYNHLEIRKLFDSATRWRGHSDTETLVEAVARWGLEGALQRTNGMFAVAIWDLKSRRLSLARDRLGEKPLYWGTTNRGLVFASELRPILTSGLGPFEVDSEAVNALLHLGYVPDPLSILRQLRKLEPGKVLEAWCDQGGIRTKVASYWELSAAVRSGLEGRKPQSDREWQEEVEAGLKRSIGLRLISDRPVGAFLSGGVDSSLIVSLLSELSARPVRTFTVGMPTEADETSRARAMADYLGTSHTEIPITEQDCLAIIPKLPQVFSEPFGDSSQIPTYLVSEITRQHVTVALSGDGGDELFAGYHRHFQARKIWHALGRSPASLRRLLAWGADSAIGRAVVTAGSLAASGFGARERQMLKLQKGFRLAGSKDLADLYRRLVSQWPDGQAPTTSEEVWQPDLPPWVAAMAASDPVEQLMAYDLSMALPGDMLVKVDRAAMAHSLETRVPFLDHEFIELAMRVPVEQKVRNGQGKRILRDLLRKHSPEGWMDAPEASHKVGFGIPLNRWLRGELREWAEEQLTPDRIRETPFLEERLVRKRWRELQHGTQAWQHPFWSILMFQAWIEEYGQYLTFAFEPECGRM